MDPTDQGKYFCWGYHLEPYAEEKRACADITGKLPLIPPRWGVIGQKNPPGQNLYYNFLARFDSRQQGGRLIKRNKLVKSRIQISPYRLNSSTHIPSRRPNTEKRYSYFYAFAYSSFIRHLSESVPS